VDLPGETAGLIPDEAWKVQRVGEKWVKGDTYNMSIGQGYVEASPLQVQNMTMTIANMGKVLRPHIVRQIMDSDGNVLSTILGGANQLIPDDATRDVGIVFRARQVDRSAKPQRAIVKGKGSFSGC